MTDAHAPDIDPLAQLGQRLAGGSVHTVVLVEGLSDQAAVEVVAERCGHRPGRDGFAVVPMHGATNVGRFLHRLSGLGLCLVVLTDANEAPGIRRRLTDAGVPEAVLCVCAPDLEAELIRALGARRVQSLIAEQGDERAFRSLQKQPEWRGKPVEEQLRRFFGAGSGRKLRYGRVLAQHLSPTALPAPLREVMRTIQGQRGGASVLAGQRLGQRDPPVEQLRGGSGVERLGRPLDARGDVVDE